MYYRKKSLEEIPEEETAIWSCMEESCNSWMRDNFAFEHAPTCQICQSSMTRSIKLLPILVNTNNDFKELKKGVQIN